jgi:hypothetical protein
MPPHAPPPILAANVRLAAGALQRCCRQPLPRNRRAGRDGTKPSRIVALEMSYDREQSHFRPSEDPPHMHLPHWIRPYVYHWDCGCGRRAIPQAVRWCVGIAAP